ncbi:hypothetical protein SAMN05444372_11732 [Flavobacterium micromati]|uniref:Uncharacterized protein n=1 Tax=Flavobacterium micromati TaxID=229205 RepID=A0A1M5QII0_9FLAO|nr:hypothetical protein [Flavobacterium micromati]SHH13915.1 hypothetical protein SAMN05444372_11732 [Flavobacterium micromati]
MKTFKLDNEPKIESGFKTPDHYFENFSSKVMEKMAEDEIKVIPIFQKRNYVYFAVAAVLVISLLVPAMYNWSTNSSEIDSVALENYITYQSNVNQYDLINNLGEEDIKNIKVNIAIEDKAIEDVLSLNSNLENLIVE